MAGMTAYFVHLFLLHQAVICTCMHGGTPHDRLNRVNGISNPRVFQTPMVYQSTKQTRKLSAAKSYNDKQFWNLILLLKNYMPKRSNQKSGRRDFNSLQIMTKPSTFSPGLNFLKSGNKIEKYFKTLQRKLKSVKSSNKSSKQLLRRSAYRIKEQLLKKRKPETSGNQKIRFNNKDVGKVLRGLRNQGVVSSSRSPLKAKSGYTTLMKGGKMFKSVHQPDIKRGSFGIKDAKTSQSAKTNDNFVIKQRTVEFMDPYTLEQLMLEKAEKNMPKQKETTSLDPVNNIEPNVNMNVLALQTNMDSLVGKSNSVSEIISEGVTSNKGKIVQGSGWQGYRGKSGNSESYDILTDQREIPVNLEMKFIERAKQIPKTPGDSMKPFAKKPDVRVSNQRPSITKDRRRLYNNIKTAYELSKIINRYQSNSNLPSWTIRSTTAKPPAVWIRQSQRLLPGDITWTNYNKGNTGKQQQQQQQQQQYGRQVVGQVQLNGNQINKNQQNGVYQNNGRQINPYSLSDLTKVSEYSLRSNSNAEQYEPQNLRYIPNKVESQDTAVLSQDSSFDTNSGQKRPESTSNVQQVESDTNYESLVDQNTQHVYQGESIDAQVYPDQQSPTNVKVPSDGNIEVQDPSANIESYSLDVRDMYELSNLEDDSDEKK